MADSDDRALMDLAAARVEAIKRDVEVCRKLLQQADQSEAPQPHT